MNDYINRIKSIYKYALPSKGTEAYTRLEELTENLKKTNNELYQLALKYRKKALSIFEAQLLNGAGLIIDNEIRFFSSEFNTRLLINGINAMPSSFFTMEAFFKHRPDLGVFEILDEEDYLLSFKDFIINLSSNDFSIDFSIIKDSIVEDLIYNFNVLNNPEEFTFTTEDGNEFIVAGVSLVRRGNEVVVFLLTGLKTDCSEETKKLLQNPPIFIKGKYDVTQYNDNKLGATKLFDNNSFWKTIAFCRIDIEKKTIDCRYIQKKIEIGFETITDDISYFSRLEERIDYSETPEFIDNEKAKIISYSPIFELATKCLYLPEYLNQNEKFIIEEEHDTKFAERLREASIFKKHKLLPAQYKIRNRIVWCLDLKSSLQSDTLYFGDNDFKIERTGYWQPLGNNVIGKDKNGNPIHGKTWVEKMLTWYEQDNQTLTINLKPRKDTTKNNINEGYIYIMRNASHDIDLFKIGLTTRDSKTRARELSKSTGTPDKFLVAQDWKVSDCFKAEKIIHERLDKYKINNRREFFKLDYQLAIKTITEVINLINNHL